MSLRSRFFFWLLLIPLVPLTIFNLWSFSSYNNDLEKEVLSKLENLAEVQEQRVEGIIGDLILQAQLIANRTQLIVSLNNYINTNNAHDLSRINDILNDVLGFVKEIRIYDLSDNLIFAGNKDLDIGGKPNFLDLDIDHYQITDVFEDENNLLSLRVLGPIFLDGELIAIQETIFSGERLIEVTEDYTGLGATGEVILAKKNSNGDALFMTPLRFDGGAGLSKTIDKSDVNVPMVRALAGEERILDNFTTTDYRGELVFAATRFIKSVEWGLVAKIDRAEALALSKDLWQRFVVVLLLLILVLSVFAFAIISAIVKPITLLNDATLNLKKNNWPKLKLPKNKDELYELTESFNKMSKELEKSYNELDKRVESRTRELKEAKAFDEAMLSSIGLGVVTVSPKLEILFANKEAEKLSGRKSKDLIGTKAFNELICLVDSHGAVLSSSSNIVALALKKRRIFEDDDIFLKRKNGKLIPVSVIAAPIILQKKLIGVVITIRDITRLKEVDKAKTEFVSLASHQLRTPLSIINWYSEALLNGICGELNDDQKDFVKEIYNGKKRMTDLISCLLNVSRLELGVFEMKTIDTDFAKIIDDIVDQLKLDLKTKKIKVKKDYVDLPTLKLDENLIGIVINNLLTNAIKYNKHAGEINIKMTKKGGKLIIAVADTGHGIPEDQHHKIFEKLFRADNIKKLDTDGNGLGMYIAEQIITKLGGKIWFESAEDKGTTFYVTFKLKDMVDKKGTKRLIK